VQDSYDFYQRELFHKSDIHSAFIEVDAAGHPAGGASAMMTPRDWLRLGQLYLQNGQWKGEQVLSQEWLDLAVTPVRIGSASVRMHMFDNDVLGHRNRFGNSAPGDSFAFMGHGGQYVQVFPSLDLVIASNGLAHGSTSNRMVSSDIIDIVEGRPPFWYEHYLTTQGLNTSPD